MNKEFTTKEVIIILLIIVSVIFFINRDYIFNFSTRMEKVEEKWIKKQEQAENPLQEFNENIFSKIEFSGIILKNGYTRDKNTDLGGSHWLEIKLIKPIVTTESVPKYIPNIYDLRRDTIKIYEHNSPDCVIDDNSIGDYISKKIGQDFMILKDFSKEDNEVYECDTLRYTTEFDYFWKNLD